MPILGTNYHRYQRYFTNINFLYRKKKVRVYTGVILSLLTIAFFAFFAIRPTLITIASLVREIKDKQIITQKLQEKINALAQAQEEQTAVSSELPLIEEALPQQPNLSFFIRQLETLSVQSGVSLRTIQFNRVNLKRRAASKSEPNSPETKKEAGVERPQITFTLSASGDYQNLKSFLQNLENLRRLIVVSSFSFKYGGDEEEQVLILDVTGQTYYLRQNERQ
jgi:Tfp pilus assembly protein PilO